MADSLSNHIIAQAERSPGIRAGIARLADVLEAPAYQIDSAGAGVSRQTPSGSGVTWPAEAKSVLVLGLAHPASRPQLDWWARQNTQGNRRLINISESFRKWLAETHRSVATPLPYHLENGGLFLKDAAVLAGLGIIGNSNLMLHPEWGPRIRLRAVLINEDLPPSKRVADFAPCDDCDNRCHRACPQNAFAQGRYSRPKCAVQMQIDMQNSTPEKQIGKDGVAVMTTKYCRACELACPAGA
jgi:epoxyqueuosine reductase